MASLFNTKISDTYPGLIKTIDNAAISASLKELTDGSGNQSGLYINNAGDFKASGILEFGSLKDTGENITITKFVDEADGIANNDNDTTIPTSAAVKDYVDTKVTGEDLDFSADSGSGSVDLDSQIFAIVGTSNEIETSGSGQQLQIGIVTNPTLTGNVTITGDVNISQGKIINIGSSFDLYATASGEYIQYGTNPVIFNGNADVIFRKQGSEEKTAVFTPQGSAKLYYNNNLKLETTTNGLTVTGRISSLTDPTDAQDAATKSYVDSQVTAQDLDFGGDTGTGSVDLDSQSLSVTGTTNQVTTSASGQTLNISLPATVHRNLQGDVTGDVTGDLTGTVTATSVLADGVTATTQTQGDNSTKVATTAYVDAGLADQDTLAEVLAVGNTTGGTDIAVSAGDDITFTDTSKAIFGDGSDLQIYHDASNSYIKDTGTGDLRIQGANVTIETGGGNLYFQGAANVASLYHTNNLRLSTSTTGIGITGGIVATGEIDVDLASEGKYFEGGSGTLRRLSITSGTNVSAHALHTFNIDSSNGKYKFDINGTEEFSFDASNASLGGNLTIAGDLTVNGTTTTVNTQTLAVEDPLISLAKDNAANSVDIGIYGRYSTDAGVTNRYLGLFADASDSNTFKLFKGTETEPTTTVDTSATGYALADLDVNVLDAQQVYSLDMLINDYIYHNGDINTYLGFPSNDTFKISTNGIEAFRIDSGQQSVFYGDITLDSDTKKLKLGDSQDFQFYHDGTNNFISSGTVGLYVQGDYPRLQSSTGENFITANINAEVNLYYDNNLKFVTTSTGVEVTGNITINGNAPITVNGTDPLISFQNGAVNHWQVGFENSQSDRFVFYDNNASAYQLILESTSGNASFAGSVIVGNKTVTNSTTNYENVLRVKGKNNYDNGTNWYGTYGQILLHSDANMTTSARRFLITNALNNNKFAIVRSVDANTDPVVASTALGINSGTADFVIDSTGLVGIGLSSPDVKFHTYESTPNTPNRLKVESLSWDAEVQLKNGNGQWSLKNDYSDDAFQIIGNDFLSKLTIDNSGNSTFASNVTANGIYSAGSSAIIYKAQRSGGAVAGDWSYDDATTDMSLGTSTGHSFSLKTGNTRALTIDASQNATFANEIYLDNGKYLRFKRNTGGLSIQTLGIVAGTDNVRLLTSGEFDLVNGSLTSLLNITNAGNATFGATIDTNGRVKVSGGNTDQYFYEGARTGVGVTYRNYDNANNIYHDSWASQSIRVNQLGGTGGGFFFSGGDFNLNTTNVHINGGTSYNDKSNIYLSNGRTLIQSDIVNGTAQGDTSLDFQTRKSGSLGSAMFIDEFRNIGINTITPQKTLHIEHTGGASEGILISGASDTVGHTAGILLRAEGGESDGLARIKGGIFLERKSGSFGTGDLKLCLNTAEDNSAVTTSDAKISINRDSSIVINGDTYINREGVQNAGELIIGGSSSAGFVDFDSTNLQLNTQRDPNTGAFVDTGKSHAHIGLQGPSGGSAILFGTIDANNTVAKTRMQITKEGLVQINSDNNTTNQAVFEQTLTVHKGLSSAGTAIPIAFVDHTHALDITVIVKQDTSNVATAVGRSCVAYGAANTGFDVVQGTGNITGLTLAYLNTNPSGQDYVLTLNWSGSGASPDAYITIRGNSTSVITEY